jgi:hypothetical protein
LQTIAGSVGDNEGIPATDCSSEVASGACKPAYPAPLRPTDAPRAPGSLRAEILRFVKLIQANAPGQPQPIDQCYVRSGER